MNCPSCSAELPETAKFCGSCGYQFADAPPANVAAAPAGAVVPIEQMVQGEIAFPDPVQAIKDGWGLAQPQLVPLIVGMLVVGIVSMLLAVTGIGALALPILYPGMVIVTLRMVNGQSFELGNFFDGFKIWLPLFLLGIVQGFLVTLGNWLFVLPGLYLTMAFMWSPFLVIDRGMDFWPAMMGSMKVVNKSIGPHIVFSLLIFALNMVGALACGLGMFVTAPISAVAAALVYKQVFGIAGGAERLA